VLYSYFFLTAPPTTQIYTLSLHDALPISSGICLCSDEGRRHARVSGTASQSPRNPGAHDRVHLDPGLRSSEGLRKTLRGPHRRRSEEHTSELQSRGHLVCRLLLEKKKNEQ